MRDRKIWLKNIEGHYLELLDYRKDILFDGLTTIFLFKNYEDVLMCLTASQLSDRGYKYSISGPYPDEGYEPRNILHIAPLKKKRKIK